ncbi:MAG TPA: CDP-alcohol phosphatidyltransferase family protein [Candidatus Dormibacteraeota bacterium]
MYSDTTARVATTLYVIAGLAWAWLSGQPGPAWLEVAWFATLAAVGAGLPGPANQVSLARAYLAAPALVYAMHQDFGLLAVCVAIAGLTDLVDGTIARRFIRPSNLGGALDPVVDGLFLGALAIGLAAGGAFPMWLAIVVIARYAVPALAGGILLATDRRPELRHTVTGQISTSLIIVLVGGICLFRFFGQDTTNVVIGAEVVIPIATIATFVHLGWVARRPVVLPEPG